MKIKRLFIGAVLAAVILLPVVSHAATSTASGTTPLNIGQLKYGLPGPEDVSKKGPAALVANLYNFAILIGGLLAFGSILYGGILYLTTGGNPTAQHEAKERIRDAIIGLLLLLGIYLVLNIVNPDLTNLRFPDLQRLKPPPTTATTTIFIDSSSWACKYGNTIDKCYATEGDCKTGCVVSEPGEGQGTQSGTCSQVAGSMCPGSGFANNTCNDLAGAAKQNNEAYPKTNAPDLQKMMDCVKTKLGYANLGSEYTWDQSHETCNYTRGKPTCDSQGTCSHAVNSCHYGGKTGTQGAEAVDYGNEAIGGKIIKAALECGAKNGRCEGVVNGKIKTFPVASDGIACAPGADHVHVNAASCDAN